MRTLQQSLLVAVAVLGFVIGCQQDPPKPQADNGAKDVTQSNDSAAKEYPIEGKVVAVSPDRDSVTIDHQDIPGLMKAMEMKFQVRQPEVLDGIEADSIVQGQLTVEGGDYVITRLRPQK